MATNNLQTQVEARILYLDLIKKTLTHYIYGDEFQSLNISRFSPVKRLIYSCLINYFNDRDILMIHKKSFNPNMRDEGKDRPQFAHTMIGLKRLSNIQTCVEDVLANNIPGDLIETGVWRGGATIFMRALLRAHQVTNRKVWVADSFKGLPKPDKENYPADQDDKHFLMKDLSISIQEVKDNFAKYGLLDDQVVFLEGWFKDTLPNAPIEKLAVLRLDGDMYESTMDGLVNLYPKLSPGGYVIVDDYGYINSCKQAVMDYRSQKGIHDEIIPIDWTGVFWKKAG